MPQGSKAAYTNKQKRQAEHIEDSEEKRGRSKKTAQRIAWATVNKQDGGGKKKKSSSRSKSGKKSSSSRSKKSSSSSSRKSGSSKVRKSRAKRGVKKSAVRKKPRKIPSYLRLVAHNR